MIYTLEELAAHHQSTGSVVSRYVPESDYKKLQSECNELAATVEALRSAALNAISFNNTCATCGRRL